MPKPSTGSRSRGRPALDGVSSRWDAAGFCLTRKSRAARCLTLARSRQQESSVMPDSIAPVVPQLSPRPVPAADLERRRAENAELIELARPHLEWLSAAHREVAHIVALVDRDGVILY